MITQSGIAKLKWVGAARVQELHAALVSGFVYMYYRAYTQSNAIESYRVNDIYPRVTGAQGYVIRTNGGEAVAVKEDDLIHIYKEEDSQPVLTENERNVLLHLRAAWDTMVSLPVQHPAHMNEFMQAIHAAQRIIMSRPVARAEGWVTNDENIRFNLPE